ncbi:MAG: energy transducer TonB [Methylocella sp.]
MNANVHTILPDSSAPSWRHWLPAIVIVLLIHAGLLFWLIHKSDTTTSAGAPEPVVMMELPPLAVAQPQESVAEVTPGPQQTEAQPEQEIEPPQEMAVPDLPPAPKPEAVLIAVPKPKPIPVKKTVKEVPKPVVKKDRQPPAPRTTAPPRQVAGARAAAPAQGASGAASASNWGSLVSAQLNRNKRYPESAQGQQGTAAVSFSVDRGGRVVSVRLVRSSGSSALDQEAVAMVHRSSPFPPPPPEVAGNLTVPVNFRPR